MRDKYGTAGIVNTPEINAKRVRTNTVRHGGVGTGSAKTRAKIERTMLERHGVPCSLSSPAIQEKRQKTNQDRFGVPHPLMNADVRNKAVATWIDKYGVDNPAKSETVKEKIVSTWRDTYGVTHPMKHASVQGRARETNIEKYGVPYSMLNQDVQKRIKETNIERYGAVNPLMNKGVHRKALQTKLDKYGTVQPHVWGRAEGEVAAAIAAMGVAVDRQYVLANNKIVDIVCKAEGIGIEYCGLFWHNEASKTPRTRNYHRDKMRAASTEGIRLITIFEDEWLTKNKQVMNALKSAFNRSKTRLGARKCAERAITHDEANAFLGEHHIQGGATGVLHARGLWHEKTLVGAMTFSRHHRQGYSNCVVLSRMCFAHDVNVAGGASRMFKAGCAWSKAQGFERIVSWSDNRWFTGSVYGAMGMSLAAELPPSYAYVTVRNPKERLSKQSQKKSSVSCPDGMTEKQWATARGLARIWDCGRKRWELPLK